MRIFSGKCELCQSQRIGTVGRGLTGRDQFICCCNRVMNLRYNFKEKIICQGYHCRPVLDVRAKLNLNVFISHTMRIKYTVLIDLLIKEIFILGKVTIELCCRSQEAFIRCCCCDRTCIHQCHRCDLTALKLGTFSVREVSC